MTEVDPLIDAMARGIQSVAATDAETIAAGLTVAQAAILAEAVAPLESEDSGDDGITVELSPEEWRAMYDLGLFEEDNEGWWATDLGCAVAAILGDTP
jgi:hypothetical protein